MYLNSVFIAQTFICALYRFLAKLPAINFLSNFADTFWIHAPYRIWESGVKLNKENDDLKMKMNKSWIPELSSWVGI